MASKKNTSKSAPKPAAAVAAKAIASTPVRNTPIPKAIPAAAPVVAAAKPAITFDAIAMRAYEIWQCQGGSESDNWYAAEAELRAA